MKEELEQHYLETTYSVFIDNDKHDIKVDEKTPSKINDLIGNNTAVILTAWNPRSQVFSLAENKSRNNYLKSALIKNDYSFYDAIGQGNNSSWQAEESFFITGISKEETEKLAVEYGQNAYVLLESKKPASLVFTRIWKE